MSRLRNIAVRMRPAASGPRSASLDDRPLESQPVAPIDAAPITPSLDPAPEPVASPPASEPQADHLQIWDLEPAASEPIGFAHPRSRAIFAREEPAVPVSAPPQRAASAPHYAFGPEPEPVTPSTAPQPGRSKTRILGFSDIAGALDPLRATEDAPAAAEHVMTAGWLIVIDGPGRGASFTISDQVASIGRDPDQTVCLNFGDSAISRQAHASVVFDPEQSLFFLGHGGKSNIVRLNGQPVLSTEELHDADRIRIGKTTLLFKALCGPSFSWTDGIAAEGGSHA